jgi:hypothetical protein
MLLTACILGQYYLEIVLQFWPACHSIMTFCQVSGIVWLQIGLLDETWHEGACDIAWQPPG